MVNIAFINSERVWSFSLVSVPICFCCSFSVACVRIKISNTGTKSWFYFKTKNIYLKFTIFVKYVSILGTNCGEFFFGGRKTIKRPQRLLNTLIVLATLSRLWWFWYSYRLFGIIRRRVRKLKSFRRTWIQSLFFNMSCSFSVRILINDTKYFKRSIISILESIIK